MIKDIEDNNENIKINNKEILALKEHFPSCFKKDGSLDYNGSRFLDSLFT